MATLIQTINFYQPRFRKESKPFSHQALFLILGLALVSMLSLSLYAYWQQSGLSSQLAGLQNQQRELQKQVEQMRVQLPKPGVSEEYQQQLALIQQQRGSALELLDTLEQGASDTESGFSAAFEGLARQIERGIWIESLTLYRDRNYVELNGKLLQPELFPRFLQKLKAEPAFSDQSFSRVILSRDATDQSLIGFELKSHLLEGEE